MIIIQILLDLSILIILYKRKIKRNKSQDKSKN